MNYPGPIFLYLLSRDRQSWDTQTPSNFLVNLENQISLNDLTKVHLANVIIPNTYYNITSLNNTFQINSVTYTIPPGSYDLLTLLSTIRNLVYPTINLSVTFSPITNVVTFSVPSSGADFTLNLGVSLLYKNLAFMDTVYTGSTTYSGMYSPNIDTMYFQINIDMFGANVAGSLSQLKGYQKTCSFLVPNTTNIGDYIFYNENSQYSSLAKTGQNIITSLNISIRDMYGVLLQNVSDWSLVLRFS